MLNNWRLGGFWEIIGQKMKGVHVYAYIHIYTWIHRDRMIEVSSGGEIFSR